jgi:hypothetical protein
LEFEILRWSESSFFIIQMLSCDFLSTLSDAFRCLFSTPERFHAQKEKESKNAFRFFAGKTSLGALFSGAAFPVFPDPLELI